jgi:TatA/E family protein of Tat protein translocase
MDLHDTPDQGDPPVNVGPVEIIVVLIIALLVFGPKRLPQMGKSLGKGVREFKKAADSAKSELGLGEVTDQINEVKSTFTEPLKDVKGTIGDLKSSVDLKSAIEAPVPGAGAAAGAAAAGLAVADAPGPDTSAGEPDHETPTVVAEPEAPAAPETRAVVAEPEAPAAPEAPEGTVAAGAGATPAGA